MDYAALVAQQRAFFHSGATLPYAFRIAQLKQLLELTNRYEQELLAAINTDLHKSRFEAWGTEVGVIQTELKYCIRQLRKWMRPTSIKTPLFHFRSHSYIQPIPHGNTLIISPWNYPFLLSIRPLIGAIAAGNTAIIKPSEHASATAVVMEKMINDNFPKEFLHLINTNAEGSSVLIKQKFDFIFYTGGTQVGKLVYQEAAKNLTPVALELGGKNPCIIDTSAQLDIAAQRIAWGKFSNAGQTCVAPDYILVHRSIKDTFVQKLIDDLESFFKNELVTTEDYGRIINNNHVNRIQKLLQGEKIIYGGQVIAEQRFIAPTLVEVTNPDRPIMQEEIFGPVLPIIAYEDFAEVKSIIDRNPDPLVLYLFTRDQDLINRCATEISCGDMSVNEVVLHFGHLHMPIGGKGASGIGKYQGKHSFTTFSHMKSVMHKRFYPELDVRYPPYTIKKQRTLKALFRYIFS